MFSEAFHEQGLQGQAQNLCYLSLFFAFKQGKCCPFFKNIFWALSIFEIFALKIGSSMNKGFKDRLRVFVFVFAFTSKQGEMLPVFQKTTFGVHLIFEFFPFKTLGSIRCFPRLSMNKGFKDRLRICVICLCFCFKTGGNAARFSKTFFGPFRSLKFLLLKIGSSMNKGFKNRVRVLFFLCFYLKTGEMLPVFQKRLLGPFDLWNVSFKNLGPSDVFRIFPWTRASRTGSEFVLFIFVFAFKTGGNAARFSKNIFGPFRSLKFLLWKLGPLQEQAQSFCFCLCLYLKTGGNAARFSKKNDFWGPFDLWIFSFQNTWVHPMFSEAFHEQGLQGQAQNLCYLSLFLL